MRLLTEEVAQVINKAKMADIIDGRFSSKPYAEEVISITLKAVGEWMEKQGEFIEGGILPTTEKRSHINHTLDDLDAPEEDGRLTFITNTTIEAFKRGERPEEAQVKSEMGFTEEELKDLRHNASDDTIG